MTSKLHEGGAHKALGYASWGLYYEAEFGQSKQQGHRVLDAARVVEALAQSPIGDSPPASESVARELVPVLREDPERVEEVWAEVVEEHGPTPTAAECTTVRPGGAGSTVKPDDPGRRPFQISPPEIFGAFAGLL